MPNSIVEYIESVKPNTPPREVEFKDTKELRGIEWVAKWNSVYSWYSFIDKNMLAAYYDWSCDCEPEVINLEELGKLNPVII